MDFRLLDTRGKRFGVLLILTGAVALLWGAAQVATAVYRAPPPRLEFARAWEASQREAARRAFADALKGIEYPDEPMAGIMPQDPEARWATGSYVHALAAAVGARIKYRTTGSPASGAIYLGSRLLVLGLALLLLFDAVVMRLVNWIVRGNRRDSTP